MKKAIYYLGFGILAGCLAFSGAIPVTSTAQSAQWNNGQRNNGWNAQELRSFNDFLTNHQWIANKLWEKPSRANSKDFQGNNPELKYYLKSHARVREALRENAQGFMSQVRDFGRNGEYRGNQDSDDRYNGNGYGYNRGVSPAEMAKFNQFLDDHAKISKDLYKNPSLVNNSDYVQDHKELRDFLRRNPAVWNALRDNPRAFMNGYHGHNDQGDE